MLNNLVIVGYSGHSFVCVECALTNNVKILGYCDAIQKDLNPFNLKYLGHERDFVKESHNLFISLGDNALREIIYLNFFGNKFLNLIHPTSTISNFANIEMNSNIFISAGATVNALATISKGVILNTNSTVEHECVISDFAHIAPGATLAGNVLVGKRTFIGANACVKQGVKIGADVVVGAGSVIINDIPDGVVVVGNPGKIIKKINK